MWKRSREPEVLDAPDVNNERLIAGLEAERSRTVAERLGPPGTRQIKYLIVEEVGCVGWAHQASLAGYLAIAEAMTPDTVAPTVDRADAVAVLSKQKGTASGAGMTLEVLSGLADIDREFGEARLAEAGEEIDRLDAAIAVFQGQ